MNRNIALCVVLSIVTLGIYEIYWCYKMNDEIAAVAGKPPIVSGGTFILLTIVTCGIYYLYWCYKQGEYMTEALSARGQVAGNLSTLYLLLAFFTGGIIASALMQNDLNKFYPAA